MSEVESDLVSVDRFVERLEWYREAGIKLTLVLGSRTSALYRSTVMYEKLEPYALPIFAGKTIDEQFQACYEVLNKEFDKYDLDKILTEALEGMTWRNIELYLAALIRQELFDVIISCSIDDCLEGALDAIGMPRNKYDIPPISGKKDVKLPEKNKRGNKILLVNIFGQKEVGNHTIRRANYFGNKDSLRDFIWYETSKETVVIGYDPVWDAELGRWIARDGGEFWYISDEQPGEGHFMRALSRRRAVRDGGVHVNHTYDYFIYNLFKRYGGKVSAHYLTQDYIYNKILEVDTKLQKEISSLKSEIRTYFSK